MVMPSVTRGALTGNHQIIPEQPFLPQGTESPHIPLAHNFLALALNRRHAVEDEIDLEARGER